MPATASRRWCLPADLGSAADAGRTLSAVGWVLTLVTMMGSFGVIGALVLRVESVVMNVLL
jgi:hypothetical protein